MTQMFENFAEQRENPLKVETTAQSTPSSFLSPLSQSELILNLELNKCRNVIKFQFLFLVTVS